MTRLRPIIAIAAALLASVLAMLPAAAQDPPADPPPPPDFPPLPILFAGTATLDGQPVERAQLSVRVGDWETRRPVSVVDGTFNCATECLIAGPPSFDYINEPVTFILNGRLAATLTFPFPNLSSPDRRNIALEFSASPAPTQTPIPAPTPSPPAAASPTPLIAAGGGAAFILIAGALLIVRRRRRRP